VGAQVVTLGEAMLRLSPPAGGRLEEVATLDVHVAGAELNVAVALASLGVAASWISALPDSPLGRRVLREARAAGVDTQHVELRDGRMGLFFVEFGLEPRPTSVWYDRERSAFRALGDFDPGALEGARYAVVSGVTAALGAAGRALTERFARLAREAGAKLCLDVNHRRRLWSGEEARSTLAPLLAEAEVVVCSRSDAAEVLGIEGAEPADVIDELMREHAHNAELVVITLGAAGALGAQRGGAPVLQPAYPAALRDRVGGGDAFVAGLLWGLVEDAGLGESLARGAALAALKRTVAGDLARFTRDEVLAVLANPQSALLR
jgi:2-dehydro-3-deoxygluconokinase